MVKGVYGGKGEPGKSRPTSPARSKPERDPRDLAVFPVREEAIQAIATAFPHRSVAETVAILDHDPYDPLPAGACPLDPEPTDPVQWLDWRTRRGDLFSPGRGLGEAQECQRWQPDR